VDEQKLILGDTGWWPGALGNYFDFETQLENVDRYVTASEVPQTRLLYIESVKVPRTAKVKGKGHAPNNAADDLFELESEASSSSSDSEAGAEDGAVNRDQHGVVCKPRSAQKSNKLERKGEGLGSGLKSSAVEATSTMMLPPLLYVR
jgi:hypothetical protein